MDITKEMLLGDRKLLRDSLESLIITQHDRMQTDVQSDNMTDEQFVVQQSQTLARLTALNTLMVVTLEPTNAFTVLIPRSNRGKLPLMYSSLQEFVDVTITKLVNTNFNENVTIRSFSYNNELIKFFYNINFK